MKNLILLFLVFSPIFSQAQNWEEIDLGLELSQNSYTKIYFVNDDVGLMIGLNGVIVRTTDGGSNWNEIQTGVTTHFNDISFADENIGFVNGLKTEDGGATWTPQESSTGFKFLHAINENHLIANTETVGNNYQESFDGGDSWETIPIPVLPDSDLYGYTPNDFAQIDDQIGYLSLNKGIIASADSLRLLKTIDGGNSWNPITVGPTQLPELGFWGFKGIAFPSESTGLLLHSEGILKTSDGGNTFVEIIPESRPEYWFPVSIFAASTEHYLLLGLKPFVSDAIVTMYETMDGGLSWTEAVTSIAYLNDATCTSNNCFAVGQGVLYRKYDTISPNLSIDVASIELYPNPSNGIFTIVGAFENYTIQIISGNGVVHQDLSGSSSPIAIDISQLPVGLYFIKVFNLNNNQICLEKILKF